MTPKERFRLRLKLQAALLRVVELVGKMNSEGVDGNPVNAATVESVIHLLRHFRNRGRNSAKDGDPESVVGIAFEALSCAQKMRQLQTIRRELRTKRRARSGK